jgi:hypothetical protein
VRLGADGTWNISVHDRRLRQSQSVRLPDMEFALFRMASLHLATCTALYAWNLDRVPCDSSAIDCSQFSMQVMQVIVNSGPSVVALPDPVC